MDYAQIPVSTAAWGLNGILVVNVKAYADRRAHIEGELARFGLHGELVLEHDADEITPEIDSLYYRPEAGERLTKGHKSCGLKHVAIMQRIVARGWRHCLVLEDDAVLLPGFRRGVDAALRELDRDYSGAATVCYIGCGGNWYTPRSQRRPGQSLYPATKGRLADSYIIGADAARLRLDWIARNKMRGAIDNEFDRMDTELGIRMLWLEPTVVEQGTKLGRFGSTLEGRWPAPIQGALHRLERFRRKYLYQLWR
ncbi:glycosyltransferase family 25 protein [Candidimonas humi]|uniref:Glycosyltransferase family 25 protein n=1 Tax=Candidimonas humi TaxID=683355 RepID=A0ABV8NWI2_9BURK|nr:glycosyltransferase family 25 protein [Candidimonas humi]MBV6303305.1 glycosyltransferase family 25 protein [Candidimonas humi]